MKKIFFLVLVSVLWLSSSSRAQFFYVENDLVGKSAPDFNLKTVDGQEVNLKKFLNGQPGIIFFWATWCPHCREAMEELSKDITSIDQDGVKLLAVDIGETAPVVKKHLERHNIKLNVVLDEESSLGDPYGIVGVPTFFFVDSHGVVKDVRHSWEENYKEILGEVKK